MRRKLSLSLPQRAVASPPTTALDAPRRPRGRGWHLSLAAALLCIGTGLTAGHDAAHSPAVAQVQHSLGFNGTVLGWTSWYGSYGLGELGDGWCIDHGTRAPDADYAYSPTSIAGETDADTQAAMAWAATMYPPVDPVSAAAGMLVQHDLRGALYPFGRLDVDAMGPNNLAGFGGQEENILVTARGIKADARAHAHLRGPFTLVLTTLPAPPGGAGLLWSTLTDAQGWIVTGAPIHVLSSSAPLTSANEARTDANGMVTFTFTVVEGDNVFSAAGFAPDTVPRLFGPTRVPAQRIIQPAMLRTDGATAFGAWTPPPPPPPPPPPETTTTTTAPPTTTTTSTTAPPETTTTTQPPLQVPPTTSAPPDTTTTTAPPATTTTSTTAPPDTPATPPPTPPQVPSVPRSPSPGLPVTGRNLLPPALLGSGLVLLGLSALGWRRRILHALATR